MPGDAAVDAAYAAISCLGFHCICIDMGVAEIYPKQLISHIRGGHVCGPRERLYFGVHELLFNCVVILVVLELL